MQKLMQNDREEIMRKLADTGAQIKIRQQNMDNHKVLDILASTMESGKGSTGKVQLL